MPGRNFGSRFLGALGAVVVAAHGAAAADTPALRLPGAGRVSSVITTRVRDGFDQRIAFDGGDGRNGADISYRAETGDLLLAFPLRLSKPSQIGIASELAVRFQDRSLQVIAPRRTRYGPLGMAIGQDCLYAWQWLERPAGAASTGYGADLLTSPGSPGLRAISIRIRLCRTATADLRTLIAAADNLVIALPDTTALGLGSAARTAEAPRRRRPARPVVTIRPKQPPEISDRPPASPATPGATSRPAQATRGAPVAATPAPQEGPRYITDPAGPAAPAASTTSGRPPDRLSRDLPPEAFRPPTDTRP